MLLTLDGACEPGKASGQKINKTSEARSFERKHRVLGDEADNHSAQPAATRGAGWRVIFWACACREIASAAVSGGVALSVARP
jgi:hypothetical protein